MAPPRLGSANADTASRLNQVEIWFSILESQSLSGTFFTAADCGQPIQAEFDDDQMKSPSRGARAELTMLLDVGAHRPPIQAER